MYSRAAIPKAWKVRKVSALASRGHFEDVGDRGGERQGGGVQHQDHFVAVGRQCATQGRRHHHKQVQPPAVQAIGARGFDLAMGNIADRPGEDFHGIGTGVEHKGQQGAVQCIAEKLVEQGVVLHHFQAVQPGVANQQLDIQRRATEQVGIHLDRPAQPEMRRDPGQRQRDRQKEAEHHRDNEQP